MKASTTKTTLLVALLGVAPLPASARVTQPDGQQAIWLYAKGRSCSDFLQFWDDEQAARARVKNPASGVYYTSAMANSSSFIQGMMNGVNMSREGEQDYFYKDVQIMLRKVRDYCEAKPEQPVSAAVMQLQLEDGQ